MLLLLPLSILTATMNEAPASAAMSPVAASPVVGTERIHLIDSLRGFALFGVLTANIWLWFSGIFFLFPDYQTELQVLTPDSVSYFLINTFISGKFITIFSFLFGLGFAIQLQRAETRGETVTLLYLRRLLILLALGLTHGFLIWYGDVLLLYSLLGFVLLLFGRRKSRTILVWVVLMMVVWPIFGGVMAMMFVGEGGGGADFAEQMEALSVATRAAFAAGGYPEIVSGNLSMLGMFWGGQYIFFMPYVLGVFLMGLLVGRAGVLARPRDFEPKIRRVRRWALTVTIPANVAMLYMAVSYSMVEVFSRPELIALQSVLMPLTTPTLSAVYVTTLVLLHQSPAWRSRFEVLAPVGRMALSNYLSQSLICISLYYGIGFGLMELVGPVTTIPIALAIFLVQIVWSRWWLQRYRFGPAEWLWRSLTYGQLQAMKRRESRLPG